MSAIAPEPDEELGNNRLTISTKPIGVGAVSERLISTGERSGLLTRLARFV
jgi:hypothetical protein